MPSATDDNTLELVEQVKTLSLKVDHIKSSLYQGIHKEYTDFYPCTQNELSKSIKPILKEINNLEDRFTRDVEPSVKRAASLHKDLVVEFENTKDVTQMLQVLCNCNRELTACKSSDAKKFVERANHLKLVKDLLDSLSPKTTTCNVKIFKVLRREYIDLHKKILNDIGDVWKSLIVWTVSTSASWNSAEGHLKTSLKIHPLPGDVNMCDLLEGMRILNVYDEKMKKFAHHVYVYFVKPLTKFKVLVPNVQKSGDVYTLNILKKVEHYKLQKPAHHILMYSKTVDVIKFIRECLFNDVYANSPPSPPRTDDSVSDSSVRSESPTTTTTMTSSGLDPIGSIGDFLWEDMSRMLINDCLAENVPTTKSQIEKYEPIYEETLNFESSLIQLGLIPAGTSDLTKYISEASVLFSNRICQDILAFAHDILLYDIHNLISVGPYIDRAAITPDCDDKGIMSKAVKNMFMNNEAIEEGFRQTVMFAFPVCHISDPVQKLLDFIYQKMVLATESPYSIASQIFHSCRDIFELFVNVVPVYHKEALKLPQLAAVHYNNCMYLAHHCATLGHQFRSSLANELKGAITTFLDYVPVLRKCGTDVFTVQLQTQKQELLAMLETCNSFTECSTKTGINNIERTFNQIVLHFKRLAKQWRTVLPENIFNQSMGVLINTVLENILNAVFRMEDISAEEGGQLHTALGILIEKIPAIVPNGDVDDDTTGSASTKRDDGTVGEKSICEHVRSWAKFQQLRVMLDSSLLEIANMWESGDGHLSHSMTEGEVRGLIRALFQNTDQRSKVLTRIKHKADHT